MINYVNSEEQYIQNYILFVKVLGAASDGAQPMMTLYHDPELQNGVTKGELANMFITSQIIVNISVPTEGINAYMNALSYVDVELGETICGSITVKFEGPMTFYSVEAEDTASE